MGLAESTNYIDVGLLQNEASNRDLRLVFELGVNPLEKIGIVHPAFSIYVKGGREVQALRIRLLRIFAVIALHAVPAVCEPSSFSAANIGMLPGAAYRSGRLALGPGDRVVVCTDGLLETVDGAGREFAAAGVARAAGGVRSGAGATLTAVLDAALEHAGTDADPADDLTLLVVARTG